MKETGITRKSTKFIYGIAILFMLIHHLFSVPERIGGECVSLIGCNENLLKKIAWSCKICVAMYAFISGYGMQKSVNISIIKDTKDLTKKLYFSMIKHYIKFMKKYWIVLFVFINIGIMIGYNFRLNTKIFINCILGIGGYINNEWWYVKQYIVMLMCFPILYLVDYNIRKKHKTNLLYLCLILSAVAVCIFFSNGMSLKYTVHMMIGSPVYTIIFSIGYLCSRFEIIEKIQLFLPQNKKRKFASGVICFVVSFLIRVLVTSNPDFNEIDVILIIPIILSLSIISENLLCINSIISKFGKYSTYMWLTHTFFCYYYFSKIFIIIRYAEIRLIILVLLSLVTAMCLNNLERGINYFNTFIRRRIK